MHMLLQHGSVVIGRLLCCIYVQICMVILLKIVYSVSFQPIFMCTVKYMHTIDNAHQREVPLFVDVIKQKIHPTVLRERMKILT